MTIEIKFKTSDPLWEIDKLIPYEQNAKVHDKLQVEKIANAIKLAGIWDQPIVVDSKGVIVKGHGRRLAAIKLGLKHVPVVVLDDATEDQIKAIRLADNRVAQSAILSDIFRSEVATLGISLEGIYDERELAFLDSDLAEVRIENIEVDLELAINELAQDNEVNIVEMDEKLVRLDKVMGFKELRVRDERVVARFMAEAEHQTGLFGAEAFVAYANLIVKQSASHA